MIIVCFGMFKITKKIEKMNKKQFINYGNNNILKTINP